MGLLKPDPEIFERVSALARCANEHLAFLDAGASNVDQALGMAFQARKVNGVDEATAALGEPLASYHASTSGGETPSTPRLRRRGHRPQP
jgi:hypothetical protein